MPNPREALTKADRINNDVRLDSHPWKRTLCPKSQPLRNPTCLPSGRGRVNVETPPARPAKTRNPAHRRAESVKERRALAANRER